MITGNESIQPIPITDGYGSIFQGLLPNGETAWSSYQGGLTIRQHFASLNMAALIKDIEYENNEYHIQQLAKKSLLAADALIAELNTNTPHRY